MWFHFEFTYVLITFFSFFPLWLRSNRHFFDNLSQDSLISFSFCCRFNFLLYAYKNYDKQNFTFFSLIILHYYLILLLSYEHKVTNFFPSFNFIPQVGFDTMLLCWIFRCLLQKNAGKNFSLNHTEILIYFFEKVSCESVFVLAVYLAKVIFKNEREKVFHFFFQILKLWNCWDQ